VDTRREDVRHRGTEKAFPVHEFESDVKVATVAPDTELDFEAARTGLGVAGKLPECETELRLASVISANSLPF
jgi:hypothetical protein